MRNKIKQLEQLLIKSSSSYELELQYIMFLIESIKNIINK